MMQFSIKQLCLKLPYSTKIIDVIVTKSTAKRNYGRWAHRRPVAIVNEDELFDEQDEKMNKVPRIRSKKAVKTARENKENIAANHVKDTVKDTFNPTVTSNNIVSIKDNERIITSLMLKVKSRNMREKHNLVMLEGVRLIRDALEAGAVAEALIFSRQSDIDDLPLSSQVKLYKTPYKTIQLWSNLTTSPGVIGIFSIPNTEEKEPAPNALPLTIICDNIRDPGNLGALLRTAAGVGCERLIMMKGCVDLWDSKVLRSASGAHFRLPIHTSLDEKISSLISDGTDIFVADNNPTITLQFIDNNETLNNVLLTTASEIRKNFDYSKIQLPKTINEHGKGTKEIIRKLLSQFPIVPYYTIDYTQNETAIVVSGETEGLSFESLKLVRDRNGIRINIPLLNNIDSLNTGTALGIITFELQRQVMMKQKAQ